jgi:hypothetical protein
MPKRRRDGSTTFSSFIHNRSFVAEKLRNEDNLRVVPESKAASAGRSVCRQPPPERSNNGLP